MRRRGGERETGWQRDFTFGEPRPVDARPPGRVQVRCRTEDSMVEPVDHFDVVVIGGGPGGSATAGLLAARGHRVLLLEREKFPRYHIGESLITGVLPVLEDLGLRERLDGAGFTKKYGGTLVWGKEDTRPAQGWRALGGSG